MRWIWEGLKTPWECMKWDWENVKEEWDIPKNQVEYEEKWIFCFLGKGALIVPVSSRKSAVSSTTVTQKNPFSTTVTQNFNNSYTEAYPLQN